MINLSMRTNEFIMKWKTAKIIPLWKGKGPSKIIPSSYRPISLLPTVSKLTEKAVQSQLLGFMCSTNQINMNHHTYRGSHSMTTALLQMSDAILEATDKNYISTLTTIDETAAFDTINFDILDKKLQLYNCSDEFRTWIRTYLNDRTQYVYIAGKRSGMKSVNMGVPQGSVLGIGLQYCRLWVLC